MQFYFQSLHLLLCSAAAVSLREGSKADPGRRRKSSLSLTHSHSQGFPIRSTLTWSRPQDLRFSNPDCFQYTWYQNEISYQNKNFVQIKNQNELIPECLIRKQNIKNIWRWLNSFQNECHSCIVWIAPKKVNEGSKFQEFEKWLFNTRPLNGNLRVVLFLTPRLLYNFGYFHTIFKYGRSFVL